MTYAFPSPDGINREIVRAEIGIHPKPLTWLPLYRFAGLLIAAADFLVIVAASIIAGMGYRAVMSGTAGDVREFFAVGVEAGLLFILAIQSVGLYRTSNGNGRATHFGEIIFVWVSALLTVSALFRLLTPATSYSGGAIVTFAFLGLGFLLGLRVSLVRWLEGAIARGVLSGRRAVVIGEHSELADNSCINLLHRYGIREIGRFELPMLKCPEDHQADLPVLDGAIQSAQVNQAQIILLALRWTDMLRCDLVRDRLRMLPLPVLLLPDRFAGSVLSLPSRELGSQIAIELQRAPLSDIALAAKRAFDVVFSTIALIALSPLLALVSIAIKLSSPGPVIFRQRRHGFNRREFTIYKFRTMNVLEDGGSIRQVTKNDVRVTQLGRLLRATSIDELPQFINVLRGDMSLVGPRPHACAHDDEYARLIGNYAFRHHIKPGITGLAQISGLRGETAQLDLMKRRVELDLWYINNWSFWLDLRVIARTCVALVSCTAY